MSSAYRRIGFWLVLLTPAAAVVFGCAEPRGPGTSRPAGGGDSGAQTDADVPADAGSLADSSLSPDAGPWPGDAGLTRTDGGHFDATTTPTDAGPPSKEEARATVDSWDRDLCAAFGWYEDGVCDDFCPDADPACWSDEHRLARETARAMNAVQEASCQLIGVMKNDNDGTFYFGRLELFDGPPERCVVVAESGPCYLRRCEELDAAELPIARDLEAGVGFTTNQSRWSSNPYWSAGSANTFRMPARGGDIEIGWKYGDERVTMIAPAPSVVQAVALGGEVRLDEDLLVDLTYRRSAAEETASPSTTRVRLTGSALRSSGHLPDAIECLVPDTTSEVRVDGDLLRALGLLPDYFVRVRAGGYLMRFADLGECRGWVVVAKNPSGRESHVGVTTQVHE